MSVAHYAWAWSVEDLTPTEKFVLVALCEFADAGTNECWPSQDLIASRTGFERRSIGRALAILEAAGLIARSSRYGSHGYRTSDLIVLQVGASADLEAIQRDRRPRDRQPRGRESGPMSLSRRSHATVDPNSCGAKPQQEEPTINPPVIPSTNPGRPADRFEEFWEVYPRKVGRQLTERVWRASVSDDIVDTVLAGARSYADQQWLKDDTFTKHPSRWLEERRWEDVVPSPRPRLTDIDARNLATITQIFGGMQTHDVIDHAPAGQLPPSARSELVPA